MNHYDQIFFVFIFTFFSYTLFADSLLSFTYIFLFDINDNIIKTNTPENKGTKEWFIIRIRTKAINSINYKANLF